MYSNFYDKLTHTFEVEIYIQMKNGGYRWELVNI